MQIELSIILVNWNGGILLSRAVDSILAFPPSVEYEVIVVDNASTDDSLATLRSCNGAKVLTNRERLRIIENKENRGFGSANNQAFELTDSRLVFLLNPDAEVTAGCIDRLIQTIDAYPRIGAAGPRILNRDGSLQVSVWRNPPSAWEIVLSNWRLYLLLPRKFRGEVLLGGHWSHDRERPVPMLGGASILLRREALNTVGGFDERFHMYGEDHEWCFRINRAGWLLMFQPEATVVHQGSWSSLQRWSNSDRIRVRLNAHYLFQKNAMGRGRLLTNVLANYLIVSGQHLWRRLCGVDATDVKVIRDVYWDHLKCTLRNSGPTEI